MAAVEPGGAAGQLLLGDLELLLPTAREEKRCDDAAEKSHRAATLLPKDAGLQRNLGDALMKLGRADEARIEIGVGKAAAYPLICGPRSSALATVRALTRNSRPIAS